MTQCKIPKTKHSAILWDDSTVDIEIHIDISYTAGQRLLTETMGTAKIKGKDAMELDASVMFELNEKHLHLIWGSTEHSIDDINLEKSPELSQVLNDRFARFQGRIGL
jgi:hypothetical protein